ncbi:hypothetical protein JCM21900_003629 [Sporobolomyces salmonicolor]
MAATEKRTDAGSSNPPAPEDVSAKPAWTATYDALQSKLPDGLARRLPSSSDAQLALAATSMKLTAFGSSVSSTSKEWSQLGKKKFDKLAPDQLCQCAWSVRNESQVAVNVSLNQVGPLYYQVLLPNETFERRTPNLWYSLEVRPYTSPSTAYTQWSAAWPILCVAGPSVALASLLAIPFVAVAAGGTALASLTAFGSSVAAGASAAGSAVTGTVGTAAGLAAKATSLPGGSRVKGKLVDAAKKVVGDNLSTQKVQEKVVRYLIRGAGAAGAAGAAEGRGAGESPGQGRIEGDERRRKAKKLDEVDVTGYEMDQVLKCATGNKKVDQALEKAFSRLSFKTTEFKTKHNPVLRLVGGPELETRTPSSTLFSPHPAPRQYLVFYPLTLLHIPNTSVEPLPLSEAPPTGEEQELMRDARVVESWEEAERADKRLGERGVSRGVEGEGHGEDREREEVVDRAVREGVEDAVTEAGTSRGDVRGKSQAEKVTGKESSSNPKARKGWFW